MEDFYSTLQSQYLPYLIEVRRRLFFIVCLFIIGSVLGFFNYEPVIKFVLKVFNFQGINIVFTSPFQLIELAVNSSLLIGFLITLPVIVIQILFFIKPALGYKEYKIIIRFLPITLFLFLLGFGYGLLMMRSTLQLFYNQSQALGIGNMFDAPHMFSTILLTSILLGVAFEFPIFLTLAAHFRLFKIRSLVKTRPFFYLVSFIFVIFLPPSDLLSDALLELPLALLFELTLLFNRWVFRPVKVKGGENEFS